MTSVLMSVYRYSEALPVLYSTTTFVFTELTDLYCFRSIVSPEGLSNIKRLNISLGKIYAGAPGSRRTSLENVLQDWIDTFRGGLEEMRSLRQLRRLLYHGSTRRLQKVIMARRPWSTFNEPLEQEHRQLFDLFSNVDIPEFTIKLSWMPDDILAQREWPFKINFHTAFEIVREIKGMPYPACTEGERRTGLE